jgi:hypothetical protein
MTNLKFVRKKMLVHVLVVIAAGELALWGLPQASTATVNQTINSGAPSYHLIPNITGSVIAAHQE